MEGVPEDKLLQSFHGFLSCPNLGTGITTLEETGIRYSAFVSFVLTVSLHFQSSAHTQYLTRSIRASPNRRARRKWTVAMGSDTMFGALGTTSFMPATLQWVRGPVTLTKGEQGRGGNWVLLPDLFIVLAPGAGLEGHTLARLQGSF